MLVLVQVNNVTNEKKIQLASETVACLRETLGKRFAAFIKFVHAAWTLLKHTGVCVKVVSIQKAHVCVCVLVGRIFRKEG
jgi:hypothetical protein